MKNPMVIYTVDGTETFRLPLVDLADAMQLTAIPTEDADVLALAYRMFQQSIDALFSKTQLEGILQGKSGSMLDSLQNTDEASTSVSLTRDGDDYMIHINNVEDA